MSTGRRRALLGGLGVGLLAALVARRWLDVVEVRGASMVPALQPGDRLLVVRALGRPRAGDVVLVPDPREPSRELVKRVAAVREDGLVVRGDHAAASTDSRTFGAIPVADARWRAVWRYWPPLRAGALEAPETRSAAAALDPAEEGGEGACTSPDALIAG